MSTTNEAAVSISAFDPEDDPALARIAVKIHRNMPGARPVAFDHLTDEPYL